MTEYEAVAKSCNLRVYPLCISGSCVSSICEIILLKSIAFESVLCLLKCASTSGLAWRILGTGDGTKEIAKRTGLDLNSTSTMTKMRTSSRYSRDHALILATRFVVALFSSSERTCSIVPPASGCGRQNPDDEGGSHVLISFNFCLEKFLSLKSLYVLPLRVFRSFLEA